MQIRVLHKGNSHFCFLDFAVVADYSIVAASFSGHTGSVNAVMKTLKERKNIDIIDDSARRFTPLQGDYTCLTTGIDEGVAHGVFIHESCFLSREEEHIIISVDGTMKAISHFMCENYALPEEWAEDYPHIFAPYIEELDVIKNPLVEKWQNMKAFRLTITEEDVVDTITYLLQSGELEIPHDPDAAEGTFVPGWDIKEYLRNNAEGIAKEIEAMKPYHNSNDPNRKLLKHIATMGRVPLPAQADVVQAVYNRLIEANYAFINGEMGSGKSIILNALINAWYRHEKKGKYTPVLITAPAAVIPKWINDEVSVDLPEARIITINSTEDALKYVREVKTQQKTGLEIVFLGIDRAKLGPKWVGAAIWKRIPGTYRYAWHCPDCFEVLDDPKLRDEDGNPLPARWATMAKNEEGMFPIEWDQKSKIFKCNRCGSKLWRPANKNKGDQGAISHRWPISRIFQKYLPGHFEIYAADEIHKQKNQSQRGHAFGQLVKSAKKVVGLTGTLTNGMSTAIKELLWHMAPEELLSRGFDYETGTIRWANNYGAVESRRREVHISGDRIRRSTSVTERPGISPRLTVEYLLGCTAFLELKDLGFPLVEKREIPIFIDMDPLHKEAYEDFHNRLNDFRVTGARGAMVPATINYADNPSAGAEVRVRWRFRRNREERIITAPKLSGYSAKERKLVEIIRDNLAEDRGCVVFTFYTGEYNINSRIKKVLEDHGIGCAVLPSSLSPDRRVSWLERKAEEGQKVIISNLNLIGEGLDLLPWPSLIFYQLSYNVDTVRQAGGRAWRIGQLRECRNYYLIVNGTQQVPQFETVMARRGHALLVEGKIDKSALADYAKDAFSTLAADIADCLATQERVNEISNTWDSLARADMEGIETIEESRYQEAVKRAMKRLTEETKKLCGIEAAENVGKLWMPKLEVVEKAIKRGKKVIAAEGQLSLANLV